MKKNITLLLLLLCCFQKAIGVFVPIIITSGFNADVIANGIGDASSSATAFDIPHTYSFVSADFQPTASSAFPTYALPTDGIINSIATSGLSYQLASYNGNNGLFLPEANPTGSISFSVTGMSDLYLLLTSTNSGGTEAFTATVNFSDNTSQTFTGLYAQEWYYTAGYAINGIGRVSLADNSLEGDSDYPGINQLVLHLDPANNIKTITGISFTATPAQLGVGTAMVILAVSGNTIPACSGTPPVATTLSSENNACSGVSFTLSLSGASSDGGIVHQWQTSPDNVNWTNAGAGSTSSTYAATQSAPTYYRDSITCLSNNLSSISTPVSIGQNPYNLCYCIPSYGNSWGEGGCADDGFGNIYDINSVSLTGENGTSINNSGTGCSGSGYADYTGSVAAVDLKPFIDYTLNLTTDYQWDSPFATVWIDLNDDGMFDNNTEMVGTTGSTEGSSLTINISDITTGIHRMRIRAVFNLWNATVTDPCSNNNGSYYNGEAEDYIINLLPPPNCVPVTNVTTSNNANTTTDLTWPATLGATFQYAVDNSNTNAPIGTINSTATNAINVPNIIPGPAQYFHIRKICSPGDTTIWKRTALSPTVCQNAVILTDGSIVSGSSSDLTTASLPASSCDLNTGNINNGIWFKYIATSAENITISACGSDYSTYMRIYEGSCGNLTCNSYNSGDWDACPDDGAASIDLSTTAGTTYYILLTKSNIFGSGNFSITVSSNPLAIMLKSFNAKAEKSINNITWSTATEDNNYRFELEKGNDGKSFSLLTKITGKGKPSDYSYDDNTPFNGDNYYRLKVIEPSGKYFYSNVIKVRNDAASGFNVVAHPNPATNNIVITIAGSENGLITLSEISGRILFQSKATNGDTQIDLNEYAAGLYLLKYSDANHSKVIKVYKK